MGEWTAQVGSGTEGLDWGDPTAIYSSKNLFACKEELGVFSSYQVEGGGLSF